MTSVILAVAIVAVIGVICGVTLSVASKFMAVKEDERFPAVRGCLPGANCGACGYAGCNEYANALLSGKETKTNLCVPGADAVALSLSQTLGTEFEEVIEQVSISCCRGCEQATHNKMNYQGVQSCAAAKQLYGGAGSCVYGCIGLGDCVAACPQGGIHIVDNLAMVNTAMCTGCGMCTKVCPNHLFQMMPDTATVVIHCRNTSRGAETRKVCSNGCIGCGKCERECPSGAVRVVDNLARIDYEKCTNCGHCAEICPTGCVFVGSFKGIHNQ